MAPTAFAPRLTSLEAVPCAPLDETRAVVPFLGGDGVDSSRPWLATNDVEGRWDAPTDFKCVDGASASLCQNGGMGELTFSDSIVIAASRENLYAMISDVTRMGEFSPVCRECWWDEDGGPDVGAWFTGRNVTSERTWETRSQVVVADPGVEFAFVVGGTWIRWGYRFADVDGGTLVTESWDFLPDGVARFAERFGDDAPAQIEDRRRAAHEGIPLTLAAIKRVAESR